MYDGKRILAIIPARGGSKGIKKKNLRMVQGKKLIEYTLDAATNSNLSIIFLYLQMTWK